MPRCYKKGASSGKKGRQGRSHESRQRAAKNKKDFLATKPYLEQGCNECVQSSMVEDNGDLICQECGLVKEQSIPVGSAHGFPAKGKGYRREVHFQQRGAKLMGRDPDLPLGQSRLVIR